MLAGVAKTNPSIIQYADALSRYVRAGGGRFFFVVVPLMIVQKIKKYLSKKSKLY